MRAPWLLTLSLACASAEPGRDAGADAAAPDAAATRDGGADRDAFSAPDAAAELDAGFELTRDPSCPAGASWAVLVHGRIEEQGGAPLAGAKAQMCIHTAPDDLFLCIPPADSGPDGAFTVAVPAEARCIRAAAMRVLAPRSDRGASYCRLSFGATGEETIARPYTLYDTRRPDALPPLGNPASPRVVRFPSGVELTVTPDRFFADYAELALAEVPARDPGLCFLDGQAPFDALYTASPEADVEGRAGLRLVNTASLAAGRAVSLHVLGSLGCLLDDLSLVPEAEWAEVDTGAVSADGRYVEFPRGLPCLSWFAIRAR